MGDARPPDTTSSAFALLGLDRAAKILLIDDDEAFALLCKVRIEDAAPGRYQIDHVADWDEGLERARSGAYDVYLVDQHLSGKTGVDLIAAAVRDGSEGPFVLITGTSDRRAEAEALIAGAVDYADKDALTARALARLLRNTLAREAASQAQREAERERNHAQRMAVVGQLAGGIAHDFNNLLQGVLGRIELARSSGDPDEREEHLRAASRSAERATRLTRRLLGTARRREVESMDVDLAELAVSTYSMLQSLLGDQIVLRMPELDGDQAFWVHVDPVAFEQVLLNLVSNSRDSMEGRGTIQVALDHDAETEEVVLSVTDDGCGMNEQVLAHAFEPYFTTKGLGEGTGLGLSIIYGIVDSAGGRLCVESEVGEGTRIEVRLPRVQTPTPTRDALESVSFEAEVAEGKVLVVDDEASVGDLVEVALQRAGYAVSTVRSPNDALALIDDGYVPDLLVTDLSMPGLDGIELATLVRETYPDLPVVLMTGHASVWEDPGLAERTSFRVLPKPFRMGDLMLAVAEELTRGDEE